MRVLAATGLVLILAAATAAGQTGASDDSGAVTAARMPSTLRHLSERIGEVDFQDAPLDQALEWIDSLSEMQIVVRWQMLEMAGIERDRPISMQVRNVRLSQLLWLMLAEAAGPDVRLAYRASDNLLVISTEEDLGREMLLKVYEVRDLLARVPRFTDAPRINLVGAGTGTGDQGTVASHTEEPPEQAGQQGQSSGTDIAALIDLIVEMVEPDSWVAGGGLGTIRAFRDQLVVWNTIRVHQALGGYVEEGH